jgi:hypothetical protein
MKLEKVSSINFNHKSKAFILNLKLLNPFKNQPFITQSPYHLVSVDLKGEINITITSKVKNTSF